MFHFCSLYRFLRIYQVFLSLHDYQSYCIMYVVIIFNKLLFVAVFKKISFMIILLLNIYVQRTCFFYKCLSIQDYQDYRSQCVKLIHRFNFHKFVILGWFYACYYDCFVNEYLHSKSKECLSELLNLATGASVLKQNT